MFRQNINHFTKLAIINTVKQISFSRLRKGSVVTDLMSLPTFIINWHCRRTNVLFDKNNTFKRTNFASLHKIAKTFNFKYTV